MMKVFVAKQAGFCFGVKRALEIAFKIAENHNEEAFTFGPIIHNPQVVEKLSAEGVKPVDDLDRLEREKGTVIIRTHGVTSHVMQRLKDAGINIIDATCPFVKKAQDYAKLLSQEGYQVVILGDRDHPEVQGLLSYAGDDAIVLMHSEPMPPVKKKVGIIVQTTQPIETLKKLLSDMIDNANEIKVYNTICNSTALRMNETEQIARQADVMVVVGGKNSANTTQLANLTRSMSVPVHHIETAGELRKGWFKSASIVGVTAGASTPDWIIDEVVEEIKGMGGKLR